MIYEAAKFSFRRFTKHSVFKNFLNCLQNADVEGSCHWATEIDLSEWQDELWDHIFSFATNHVLNSSPKICVYLEQKFESYLKLVVDCNMYRGKLCLITQWRDIWVEVVGVLALSQKQPISIQLSRIEKNELDRYMEGMRCIRLHPWLLTLPEYTSSKHSLLMEFLSRLVFAIELQDFPLALYILSLLFEYDSFLKQHKSRLQCMPRDEILTFAAIKRRLGHARSLAAAATEQQQQQQRAAKETNWIWVLWDTFDIVSIKLFAHTQKLVCLSVRSLRRFCALGFDSSKAKQSKIFFILQALSLLIHPTPIEILEKPILSAEGTKIVQLARTNIQCMYDDIHADQIHQMQPQQNDQNPINHQETQGNLLHSFTHPLSDEKRNAVNQYYPLNTVPSSKPTEGGVQVKDSMEKLRIVEELDPYF